MLKIPNSVIRRSTKTQHQKTQKKSQKYAPIYGQSCENGKEVREIYYCNIIPEEEVSKHPNSIET